MTSNDPLFHLKYPIGKYNPPSVISENQIAEWIDEIETFPTRLKHVISDITESQLDTLYRPEGWTVRQLIHHIPDSHVNCYIRFKWALTEDRTTIKPYNEAAWAVLPDTYNKPVDDSIEFLTVVHKKLTNLFRELTSEQLKRTFIHPEYGIEVPLDWNIGQYAWHGNHHLAHIKLVINN